MNCTEAKSLLTNYLLGDLEESQASAIRAHIETCENCSAEAAELRPTLDLLRDAFADTAPAPATLEAGRHAAIYKEQTPRKGTVVEWVTGHYPVVRRLAAALLVCGLLGVFAKMLAPMSAYKISNGSGVPAVSVAIMEPEALAELDDIMLEDASGLDGDGDYATRTRSGSAKAEVVKAVKHKRKMKNEDAPAMIFAVPDLSDTDVDRAMEEQTMSTYTATANARSGKVGKGGGGTRPGWPQGMAGGGTGRDYSAPPAAELPAANTEKSLDNWKTDSRSGDKVDVASVNGSFAARADGRKRELAPGDSVGGLQWSVTKPAPPATPAAPSKSISSAGGRALASKGFSSAPKKPAQRPLKKEGRKNINDAMQELDQNLTVVDGSTYELARGGARDQSFDISVDEKREAVVSGGFMEKVPLIGGLFRRKESAAKASAQPKDMPMADGYAYNGIASVPAETRARESKRLENSKRRSDRFDGKPAPVVTTIDAGTVQPSSGPESEVVAEELVDASVMQWGAERFNNEGERKSTTKELRSRLEKMPEQERQIAYAEISLKKGNLGAAQTWYAKAADSIEDKRSEEYLRAELGSVKTERITKDFDSALEKLDKLQSVADEAAQTKIRSARAEVLLEMEDYTDASKEIDAVLQADPGNKDALVMQGKLQLQMRKLVEASEIELGSVSPEEDEEEDTTRFKAYGVNPVINVSQNAFSTFSIDVDTASYTLARNYIENGSLPPAEAVRTEEIVNFFDYSYKAPQSRTFAVYAEVAPSKFGRGQHLLKIGVKGKRLGREEQRRAVLTFLVDTSGSMETPDRIGLVKKSLKMLVDKLSAEDLVSIVQYDSRARLVLSHTQAAEKNKINEAIDSLQCSGSTNLEQGMNKAYEAAAKGFISKGENRVLILSDGVANLGDLDAEALLEKVGQYRKQGIYCSVFGVGMGTYDDVMLETLANKGDGTYAYLDSEEEAKRLFVDDLAATLNTIARDVKIQVEFNRNLVSTYRQLGYENRQLTKEQFRDDTVDAGEVGSGQSVTALYEIEMQKVISKQISRRRLMPEPVATVRVRYRRTDNDAVEEIEIPVTFKDFVNDFNKADARFRLAACAAEFSEILRGSPYAQGSDFRAVSKVLAPVALELDLDQRVQGFLRMTTSAPGMARGK